jgi:two-component system alkaline phosphatase synthesis response regulator PhoP
MEHILAITESAAHIDAVTSAMRREGHLLRSEPAIDRGLLLAREWNPTVLLLDLDLGLTAGGLAALLRDPHIRDRAAVIAICRPQQLGLIGPGVDVADFLLTPLDEDELRLRVGRLLWSRTGGVTGSVLQHGGLMIDLERYTVTVDDQVVDLTYKEYELLRFLASNAGKPFTREALLNRVWGYDYYGGSRTVDVHIRRIRSKIERHEPYIETVRNVGYRFIDPARLHTSE